MVARCASSGRDCGSRKEEKGARDRPFPRLSEPNQLSLSLRRRLGDCGNPAGNSDGLLRRYASRNDNKEKAQPFHAVSCEVGCIGVSETVERTTRRSSLHSESYPSDALGNPQHATHHHRPLVTHDIAIGGENVRPAARGTIILIRNIAECIPGHDGVHAHGRRFRRRRH